MKIAIACHHYPVASGRYVADAFRRLGHEVKTIGNAMGTNIWGMTVDAKYEWKPDSPIHKIDVDWPDLVVVMDSDPRVWGEVSWDVFYCPVVVYGVDNHVRTYENELFNHYFLAHYHGAVYPVDPARKDHTWLPCAADPMFTRSPIPWHEREYDVCMVGVPYPERQMIIALMQHSGLKVFAETGLLYEEYRNAYWNSRISLCKSVAGDVAQRIFETGRMGCAILTDPLKDLEDPVCNAALKLHGYAVYTSPQLAVAIAREMLAGDMAYELTRMSKDRVPPTDDARQIQSVGTASAAGMAEACYPHTWDARAQAIVDWYEREHGGAKPMEVKPDVILYPPMAGMSDAEKAKIKESVHALINGTDPTPRKPFLNLGCGTTHFPSEPPPGHEFIDPSIYAYPEWVNVDKVEGVGADKVFDLFTYPWPLEDNSFDGAVLGHIAEHIPHEIKLNTVDVLYSFNNKEYTINNELTPEDKKTIERASELAQLQDGWYAFFSELYRVMTPGAIAHIISPYAWSQGAVTDPTHTRLLTQHTFEHGLSPEQYTGTFKYNIACNFAMDGHQLRFSPWAQPFVHDQDLLANALMTRVNMVYDFYVRLKVVK
jgi:hypothetical protein